jgi:hypothetical protein
MMDSEAAFISIQRRDASMPAITSPRPVDAVPAGYAETLVDDLMAFR